ncbi:hypothetical protein AHiyo1_26990 [Arthrobacter sp. Hiyo1]|nr:hypothetical protein AHiyo1_26990 [Arthrobacter sp. Hiyo1]
MGYRRRGGVHSHPLRLPRGRRRTYDDPDGRRIPVRFRALARFAFRGLPAGGGRQGGRCHIGWGGVSRGDNHCQPHPNLCVTLLSQTIWPCHKVCVRIFRRRIQAQMHDSLLDNWDPLVKIARIPSAETADAGSACLHHADSERVSN